ncbi:MAG: UTP--glucose-1-phosphate uridylyltransferase, partial [Planctomycetota bacterium]
DENSCLGLDPAQVRIFQQGIMPAVDAESGRLILSAKDSLAMGPDGHGGTLAALDRTGALDAMLAEGVEHLFYFQVDNPLITLCDPVFIGHHILSKSEMTTQVIRKRYPTEKVGNVVQVDGRTRIIEYSDLPDEAAEMTLDDGSLKLWAGNIAVHLFELDFLKRAKSQASALPFHRAHKKVPFVDDRGHTVHPDAPNATKFERFIFDLLPSADRTLIYEVEPADAFAPVKNANGAATDTPELAQKAMVTQHQRLIRQSGGDIKDGVTVEINPRFAMDSTELAHRLGENLTVETDRYFAG